MDKIWDRNLSRRSLAVVVGMKKMNDNAEPSTAKCLKETGCKE